MKKLARAFALGCYFLAIIPLVSALAMPKVLLLTAAGLLSIGSSVSGGVDGNCLGVAGTNLAQQPCGGFGEVSSFTNGDLDPIRVGLANINGTNGASGIGSRFQLLIEGDSTCAGIGTGTSGTSNATGARGRVWSSQVVTNLVTAGIPAQDNSVFGDSNMTQYVTYNSYDPRVSLGSGWVTNNTSVPGGFAFTFTNAASGGFGNASATMSFTPANQIDTFTIFWRNRASGTLTVNVDGGAALTATAGLGSGGSTITIPSSYSSYGTGYTTFSAGSLASHTINIIVQSGNPVDVAGIHAWNSTIAYVDMIRICTSGATIASFDSSTYFGDTAYFAPYVLKPNYMFINLTVNDSANGTTAASYQASLNDIFQKRNFAGVAMNIGFMIGPYTTPTGFPVASGRIPAAITGFIATNQYVYANNDGAILDFASRWTGTNGGLNLTGGDGVHPTYYGTTDIAKAVTKFLTQN